MNISKRKININNYYCKTFNDSGFIQTFNPINNLWDNSNSYMKIPSNIINPYYNENKYGVYILSMFTHQQMINYLNDLYSFHQFIYGKCSNCRLNIDVFNTSIYIKNIESYIINGGNKILSFTNTYYNSKFKQFYNIENEEFLIDFILNDLNLTLDDVINVINSNSEDSITKEEFLKDYYNNNDSIVMIGNLLKKYYYKKKINLRDVTSEQNINIDTYIDNSCINYINNFVTCDIINIPNYNKEYTYDNNVNLIFPLNINATINYNGINTNLVKNWEVGKKYYVGDIVIFNDKTYILTSNNESSIKENGYIGFYNGMTKETYFDVVILDNNGFFKEYIMNDNDFTHWKRNIAPVDQNNFIRKETIFENQLNSFKSYRNNIIYKNFFDVDGVYKKGLKFNIENYDNILYYNIIKDIIYHKLGDGHETLTYIYLIAHSDKYNDGIEVTQVFHRYKVGDNEYIYNFDEIPTASYLLYGGNNMNNYELPNVINNVSQKHNENTMNYNNYIINDYFLNIMDRPSINVDINIDRGLNATWEQHLKLGEVHTLEDLVEYQNGFFNVKKNNE